jgi:beta-barrel assembly-enhancing protease
MTKIINSFTVSVSETLFRGSIQLILFFCLAVSAGLAQSGKIPGEKLPGVRLEEKNNPELIGKRNINKGNLSFYSIDREINIGRQMALEIDQSSKIVTDPVINEFINRIGQNIVLHSDSRVPFTIKVIDSPEVNAFALPGGFLYVNRGLLEAAENEAEVAGVLAHEIAHVAARHGIEQASKGEFLNYASLPLIFLGGWGGYIIQQIAGVAVPLTFLKFSRNAESEADRLGAQYMWATGYDPTALISFFEKLQSRQGSNGRKGGGIAKVFSTHPMTADRITNVRKLIIQFPDRGEYQLNSSDFAGIRARLAGAAGSSAVDATDRPVLRRQPKDGERDADPGVTNENGRETKTGQSSAGSPDGGNTDRPVLKRRGEAESNGETKESKKVEEAGRPTLRRRPDSL